MTKGRLYPRSMVTEVSTVLASTRSQAWSNDQLIIIDTLIANLADEWHDLPGFNPDQFARRSRRWWGRADDTDTTQDTRRKPPCRTTQ